MKHFALTAILLCLSILSAAPLPAQEYTQTPVTVSSDKVKGSDGKLYYSHVVQERQTLFSISKAYGVTIDAIFEANPGLKENGLKKNEIILIPVAAAEPAGDNKDDYIIHTVRWFENIDDIALKYNVPADVILKYNSIKGRKLKARQKIKIPKSYNENDLNAPSTTEETAATQQNENSAAEEEEASGQKDEEESTWQGFSWNIFGRKDKVKVSLIMPFGASGNRDSKSFDFYSGVLLALRALKEDGVSTDLSVYDCATSFPVTKERVDASDIVIGPIAASDIKKVLELGSDGTVIISPLDQKALSFASVYTNFIQAPTPYEEQYKDIVRWVSSDKEIGDEVLVISEKGKSSAFGNVIATSGLQHKDLSYSVLEGRNITTSMERLMSKENVNRVILNSESETFINDAIRNLSIMNGQGYRTILYSPSKIHSFDSIDPRNLHELSLHMSMSYYIDYSSQEVKNFLLEYRALFNTEPSQFAYQGYDIAKYFIGLCSKYGSKWLKKIDGDSGDDSKMLQSTFDINSRGAGYANSGVRRVVYEPDFRIRTEF